MRFKILLLCFTLGLTCCNKPQNKTIKKFKDIKGYFLKEASRLQKSNHPILKTANQNGTSITKIILIGNWANELASFIESDINKSSWKNSYRLTISKGIIEYIALDDNLKTQKITIYESPNHAIKSVDIINRTKNALYNSEELLKYIPDSVYQITKNQHVLLMNNQQYKIEGRFKH